MQVGELIKFLADYCPDTNVKYLPTDDDENEYDIILSISDDNNTIYIQEDLGLHRIVIT